MRAKTKKAPMTLCSVRVIAIELKGLATPGEALENYPALHATTVSGSHKNQDPLHRQSLFRVVILLEVRIDLQSARALKLQ